MVFVHSRLLTRRLLLEIDVEFRRPIINAVAPAEPLVRQSDIAAASDAGRLRKQSLCEADVRFLSGTLSRRVSLAVSCVGAEHTIEWAPVLYSFPQFFRSTNLEIGPLTTGDSTDNSAPRRFSRLLGSVPKICRDGSLQG